MSERADAYENARRETLRILGLTLAYKAAVDDLARVEVILAIRGAAENVLGALSQAGNGHPRPPDAS